MFLSGLIKLLARVADQTGDLGVYSFIIALRSIDDNGEVSYRIVKMDGGDQ